MGGVELDRLDQFGRTPLHIAVSQSAIGVVKLLLKERAPVDTLDVVQEATPLHLAVHSNQLLIVKHLLKAKADLNLVSTSGDTPLSIAGGRGFEKIIDTLVAEGPDRCRVDVLERVENDFMKSENEWRKKFDAREAKRG